LKEEKESLGCHPCDQQEGAGPDSQHNKRPEIMIVSLLAQRAFFFNSFALRTHAHSFTICAGDETTISGRPL
jgi:hypothetical protein